ncbi:MAG: helix-turn-helix domain-containing protein, partial [Streptosporangiaceae bacterium]
MNSERISELERRAILHAALADPARLRITDTLLAGDASPSELAAMLAMPSNLLTHHLHVLEQAGILTRRRSEGDRRRTYLQLIPGALDQLAPPSARAALRVLFVCTAHSARSHLAAALWRQASTVPAVSAGTHPAAAIDRGAIAAATRHSLPRPRLRPRHISEVRHDGDLVITVCDLAHEELAEAAAVHWS